MRAALEGLAGLERGSDVEFIVTGSASGIEHGLESERQTSERVAMTLRASIPGLRVEPLDAGESPSTLRWDFGVTGRVPVLREVDHAAHGAALLSSLQPLRRGEIVELRWSVFRVGPTVVPRGERRQAPAWQQLLGLDGSLTPDHRRAAAGKAGRPGFAARGEIAARGASLPRARYLAGRPASVLRSLATPYGQVSRLRPWLPHRRGVLSADELACLLGWPIGSPAVPGVALGSARQLLPSAKVASSGRVVGVSNFPGAERSIALSPVASTRHMHVLGPTGSGKTTLLLNLGVQDMEAGRGLAVVETRGDLIADLLDRVPPGRRRDVVLIDPSEEAVVGLNPLAGPRATAELRAEQTVTLFKRIFGSAWGPRTDLLVRAALYTLALSPGMTLVDAPRVLTDAGFRARLLSRISDPLGLESTWAYFDSLSEAERSHIVGAPLNKLAVVVTRSAIRAILGQTEPRVSFADILAGNKILLVNLARGVLGEEAARLLGGLVVSALWNATEARARLGARERRPFIVTLDEFQDFVASPVPFDDLLAQARGYGVGFALAHQHLGQLPADLRRSVSANARSKLVFQLGAEDAREVSREFAPYLKADDLQGLGAREIAALLAQDDGQVAPAVTAVTRPAPPATGQASAVREASRTSYAVSRREVEAALLRRDREPEGPVGRRRRTA